MFFACCCMRHNLNKLLVLETKNLYFFNKRHIATESPLIIKTIFQYGSDAYITQGLQAGLEVLQSSGYSPVASFLLMGLGLRIATAPAHFYAEKLLAKRIYITNFLTQNILKKFGNHYGIIVVANEKNTQITLDTKNTEILKKAHSTIDQKINEFSAKNRIQKSRIINLKVMTTPIWFYSSFAIRNELSGDFRRVIEGFGWLKNMADVDPYYIIPICVGVLGFFNIYSQRLIYPRTQKSQNIYDGVLIFSTLAAVKIMTTLPVCIPLYWLTVSLTGILQNQMLRHPKIKKMLGINRLPTDSATPFRDLFFLRKPPTSIL